MIGLPPSDKWCPADDDDDALLLREIESLSRALSAEPKHQRIPSADPKPKTASSSSSRKDKKTSFWNWKPLKALSHIGQRRFDCVFFFHVHSIENIPDALADAALSVQWKRTTDPPSAAAGTSPVRVFGGVAEFEETLTYRCSVYGARRSSNHSAAKYEARRFLIYASVCNSPGLDLGMHLVDLTRFLPLTLEELDDAGSSSGKWSTSFRLTGEGRGASLSVSFGFSLIRDGALESIAENRVFDVLNLKMVDEDSIVRGRSKGRRWLRSQSVEDVKVLHELLPTSKSHASSFADSIENMNLTVCDDMELFDSETTLKTTPRGASLEHVEGSFQNKLEEPESAVIVQGVEISAKDKLRATIFEKIDLEVDDQLQLASKVEECALLHEGDPSTSKCRGMATHSLVLSEPDEGVEILHFESEHKRGDQENDPFCFDVASDAIATEFLNMLSDEHGPSAFGFDSHPESPRERLWKQFEEETLGAGCVLFGLGDDGSWKEDGKSDVSEDLDSSPALPEAEREVLNTSTTHVLNHSSRAELLEAAKTEALMDKWGLEDDAFQCSLPGSRSSFMNSLGAFVQTKDGGFLRSMSPSLFKDAKHNASLIMQVSSPVVVPAEMGSDITKILQRLASVRVDKLLVQAKKLMPIEDVSGKTMQQMAFEAANDCRRSDILLPLNGDANALITESVSGRRKKKDISSSSTFDIDSEYVSIKDLASLAMDKIEPLSMEGLRIQSGMSTEEAPSNVHSHCFDNDPVFEVKEKEDDVDELLRLSITLDEWVRLDSGVVDDEVQTSDRTSKILAAHSSPSSNLVTGGWKEEAIGGRGSGRRWGLLGSNFTAALMVQLRDPLRNYEPVGTPMLALIQVERVFVPSNLKGNTDEDYEPESEIRAEPGVSEKEEEDDAVHRFKITGVHVAGLKTEPNKKKVCSRWLLASGMGKSNKHPFMRSKFGSEPSAGAGAVPPGDALWSISSVVRATGSKLKELAVNSHIRNPNVIFPKQTGRSHSED